jgi:hypothetical protein
MRTKIVGKLLMALIFASVIGGLSAGPALSDNDHRGKQGRHDNRSWHNNHGREVYRPYRYRPEPIYAPPPVIYVPLPSPGISIFFSPIHIR